MNKRNKRLSIVLAAAIPALVAGALIRLARDQRGPLTSPAPMAT